MTFCVPLSLSLTLSPHFLSLDWGQWSHQRLTISPENLFPFPNWKADKSLPTVCMWETYVCIHVSLTQHIQSLLSNSKWYERRVEGERVGGYGGREEGLVRWLTSKQRTTASSLCTPQKSTHIWPTFSPTPCAHIPQPFVHISIYHVRSWTTMINQPHHEAREDEKASMPQTMP